MIFHQKYPLRHRQLLTSTGMFGSPAPRGRGPSGQFRRHERLPLVADRSGLVRRVAVIVVGGCLGLGIVARRAVLPLAVAEPPQPASWPRGPPIRSGGSGRLGKLLEQEAAAGCPGLAWSVLGCDRPGRKRQREVECARRRDWRQLRRGRRADAVRAGHVRPRWGGRAGWCVTAFPLRPGRRGLQRRQPSVRRRCGPHGDIESGNRRLQPLVRDLRATDR